MKILIISNLYAPDRVPRAYRWTAVAEHMAALGHDVTVIAAWKWGDARAEIRNGVRIRRVGEFLAQTLRGLLGARPYADNRSGASPDRGKTAIRNLARAIYSATWARIFWPDYAVLWGAAARRAAQQLLRGESFDALITVSHPFTAHMVGLSLKREHPHLPWITDIGDPFSLPIGARLNNAFLYGGLNRRAEAAVLNAADAVSVTFEGARAAYAKAFPRAAVKLSVIPPLLSLPKFSRDDPYFKADGPPALVYVGTFYRTVRSPACMLALFRSLKDSGAPHHLHVFGDTNDTMDMFEPYKDLIGRAIHLHGVVSRAEVTRAMTGAAALVNIGNSTPHQIASKLVEYVAASRPIVNLVSSKEDTSLSFLSSHPSVLTLVNGEGDLESQSAATLRFLSAPPAISPDQMDAILAPHGVEAVTRRYVDLIEQAKTRAPHPRAIPAMAGPGEIVAAGFVVVWAWALFIAYYVHNADYYLEKLALFSRFFRRFPS
jgi:hypothetical protein